MSKIENPLLRALLISSLSITLVFCSFSPVFDNEASIDSNPTFPSFELERSAPSIIGAISSGSAHKLLPASLLKALFDVFPLIPVYFLTSFQMLLYPSFFLPLKQQFLFPIKFTSVFVIPASR